ncbi:ABC transporter permease [Brevibacillus daliensis]|uniref:ABC transporter permease n=1 Tax=Brevibacillus daliensis TaxID=2892995 RepID=UPI001E3B22FD|nr:ABC transporter permease [Brevibacillus daliensis]
MKALALEFFKLRRKWILVMTTLFLGAEMFWAFMSISKSMARNPDSTGWEAIIVTIASMNGLFLPIISAIVVSRICDMEHKGNTWKLLISTDVKRNHIYMAKYVCATTVLLYYIVLQTIAIAVYGIVVGIASPLPPSLMIQFIGGGIVTNFAIVALQQWVSLSIKNQAFALSLGMVGGFMGMTSDLFPVILRRIFIWSYYSGLSPVSYHFTNHSMEYVIQPMGAGALAIVLFMSIIFYFAGSFHVTRQEV